MKFDFNNNIPIYIQIVEQIKTDIVAGKFKPGERLPSVRDFATESKVNPNTMQKALVELEESGLVFTERTNGKFITHDTSLINFYKQKYAEELTLTYLKRMYDIGYSLGEISKQIEQLGGKK